MSSGACSASGAVSFVASQAFGEYACSFTAEAKALTVLLTELTAAHLASPGWSSVAIFTDSQSCLAALARGPGAASDALIVRIWELLLQLSRRGVRLTLAFIFGHVGFSAHDDVDELARQALSAAPPRDVWWRDGCRPQIRRLWQRVVDGRPASWWLSNNGLTLANGCPRMPHAAGTALLRLRTGVDPAIGGWRHGFNDPCPLCAKPLERGHSTHPSGIQHFFECGAASSKSYREEHKLDPQSLWDPAKYSAVLAYRALFRDAT